MGGARAGTGKQSCDALPLFDAQGVRPYGPKMKHAVIICPPLPPGMEVLEDYASFAIVAEKSSMAFCATANGKRECATAFKVLQDAPIGAHCALPVW